MERKTSGMIAIVVGSVISSETTLLRKRIRRDGPNDSISAIVFRNTLILNENLRKLNRPSGSDEIAWQSRR